MTTPRERPILFNSEMVRALLAGTKTQTRRVIKPRASEVRCASDCAGTDLSRAWADPGLGAGAYLQVPCRDGATQRVHCPHGDVGNSLWVKETHAFITGGRTLSREGDYDDPECVDGPVKPFRFQPAYRADVCWNGEDEWVKWRPSMFMPRWASRITLEITNVRVQQINDTSHEDAIAEGITPQGKCWRNVDDPSMPIGEPRTAYRMLWDSINYERGFGWDTNPWVWAITFNRVQP